MNYEVIIGLEVHVQLATRTKAFCACKNAFGGDPNSRVCPVCMGLPGALPVVNSSLIEDAILAGLSLNCEIAKTTKFDRKNYVYPDLPKGYQISQFDMPICVKGSLDVETDDGDTRRVRILRLHMEEDAGKNIHAEDGRNMSFVDFNRCGTPLLEIVSEPDLRSAGEAVRYVQSVREILRYLGVSDCNMEEASLRCDANINLWIYEDGTKYATPIAEIKNMNSFRSIRAALAYEAKRQVVEWREHRITLAEGGKTTRGFDESRGVTVLQRSKEEAADYRYFPEPDLKAIEVSDELIAMLKLRVGELPADKRKRFADEFGIGEQDALVLTESKALAEYFEEAADGYHEPQKIANWLLSEVKKYLNAEQIGIDELRVSPDDLRSLMTIVDSGKISGKIAKDVFVEMAGSGDGPEVIIERLGLSQISNEDELETLIVKIVEDNPSSVDDYRAGKQKALGFLMGQIMKASHGKANPQLANRLLRDVLGR